MVAAMSSQPNVVYAREEAVTLVEFRQVLVESGLGASRPTADEGRLQAMLAGSDLLVTARLDQPDRRLVGIARGVSDFAWCCYLSEVAVASGAQGLGVGRGLLDEARRQLGPAVSLILVSVPEATGFYGRVGMARIPDAFWFRRSR